MRTVPPTFPYLYILDNSLKRNGIAQKKWTKINVQFSFSQNSFVKNILKKRVVTNMQQIPIFHDKNRY